jgi:hypothetical protein
MSSRIEVPEQHDSIASRDPVVDLEVAAEQALWRALLKGILIAVPLMIAFWVLMVAVAVGVNDADWAAWLGMAAGIGVLAGVFFGAWAGFVSKSHTLDEIDVVAGRARFEAMSAPQRESGE